MPSGYGAWGQDAGRQDKEGLTRPKEVPPPENVLMVTRDGVELRATWFAGTRAKETIPIVLVHDWGADRSRLLPLAKYLQTNYGHAVLVPDLRGHGQSITVKGSSKTLDYDRFRKAEVATVWLDIDACRKFLQEKNNAGELNLDLMTLLAVGKMSPLAVGWCVEDWKWPPVAGVKQGQNVKALILISPERKFKGVSMTQLLKLPLFAGPVDPLSVLLIWGRNHSTTNREGDAIYTAMNRKRPEVEARNDAERWEKQSLYRVPKKSSAVGHELLEKYAQEFYPGIAMFIEHRVWDRRDEFRWQNRDRD